MSSEGMTHQSPDYIHLNVNVNEDSTDEHTLEELPRGCQMFKHIEIDFQNAGIEIEQIQRLHNPHLRKKYVTERDLLLEQRQNLDPNFKLNEKYLYHGTTLKKLYICEEGLDSRVSKEGCFGRGIYFSDFPRKCIKYAEKGGSDESFILLMRVILGDSKVYAKGKKDRNLVREPEKPQPCTGFRYYDSVEGCPVNHKEFVVYENRRALVECIITYKKVEKQKDSTTSPASYDSDDSSSDGGDDGPADDNSSLDGGGCGQAHDNDNSSDDDQDDDDDDGYYNFGEGGASAFDAESLKEGEEQLEKLEKDFSVQTGVKDKHVADTYILMANMDLEKAVELYKTVDKDTPDGVSQEEHMSRLVKDLRIKVDPTQHVDSERWKNMSTADREGVTQCLIDNFLEVVGKDKGDEEERTLARKYLQMVEMNLDLAIVAYYEDLAGDI